MTFLFGLFVIAPQMEADTEKRVFQALSASSFNDFIVKADGQRVSVNGVGSASSLRQITAIARSAACDTWIANNVICPTHVKVDLVDPPKAKAAAPVAETKAKPVTRLHDFTALRTTEGVTLKGEVPSLEFKTQLLNNAKTRFDRVNDELRITNVQAGPNINWAATQSVSVLSELNTGGTSWKSGSFSAWGEVDAEKEMAVRDLFSAASTRALLGSLDLQIRRTTDACNERFAAALSTATIRFRTSSAEIAPQSQPLLERLAALAKECPFQLDVEGHTDSRGAADMNQQLSLARAQAVINTLGVLGVDTSRLTARGFGPDRPVADNQTREGRAQNRRIEIKSASND